MVSASTSLSGRWSVVGDLAVRQVAAGLAQGDQGLEAGAALGQVFLGEHGLVEAEFLHQGAFLRLADLHAKGLDLFLGRRGFVSDQFVFDVRQVDIAGRRLAGGSLGLAATLGAAGGGCRTGRLGRAPDLAGGGGGCVGDRCCGGLLGFGGGRRFGGHGFHFRSGCRLGRGDTRLSCRQGRSFQRFLCNGLAGGGHGRLL
jgi:hypothetical protein